MREIKFRCWGKGQMYYLELIGNNFMWINEQPLEGQLMQYTELKDKNGKEIYEGDIVATEGKNRLVEYRPDQGFFGNFMESQNPSWYEITGNIYENPELLTAHQQ